MSQWIEIGVSADFTEEATAVNAGGRQIAVFRLGEELFALRDLCTHGNARLSDGYVEQGCVECPLHQGLFDIRSGEPRSAPVTEAVLTFPVRITAGKVEIDLDIGDEIQDDAQACAGCNTRAAGPVTFKAEVASVSRPAEDVAIVTLAYDPETIFTYRAGQYLDVLIDDGRRRSYSMATPSGSGLIELHIRHLPGGRFSDYVFDGLNVGDQLALEGPAGNFWLREGDGPVIFLASGTGFAPVKAIIEQAIDDGLERPMILYWGGRTRRDLYLDSACRAWQASLSWFDYIPVLSEATNDVGWQGRTGFVHEAVMQDFPHLAGHQVYACGAPVMVEAARRDLINARGVSSQGFFSDAFLSGSDRK